jgi:hypothetical protein
MQARKTDTKHSKPRSTREWQPLVSNGFRKVTTKRPCRICRKTDWCGYSTDERTSICMRVSDGAKGTARNGGNIHVHSDVPPTSSPGKKTKPVPPSIEIAPIEIRDAVYRELIRISPAQKYYPHLVDGPDGLLSRGLLERETQNYGALLPTQKERAQLARQLRQFVIDKFPEYGRLYLYPGVIGIPGFWQDANCTVQLWKPREYKMPMLVIPYNDNRGRIQACQLRLQKSDISEGEKRYRWLASPLERHGISSGSPIHFTFSPSTLSNGKTVVITEGALKADTLVSLRPQVFAIATSGVSCSHEEVIEAVRTYNTLIAFDADHKTNPAVCRQLARLIAAREQHTASRNLPTSTRIVYWEGYKGIDDAAKAANVTITTLSILEWFATLEGDPVDEVKKVWTETAYQPVNQLEVLPSNHYGP